MPIRILGGSATLQDVLKEWRSLFTTIDALEAGRLQGRIRTNKRAAAPTAATDLESSDKEGDVFVDGTYTYTLITVSGTLLWNRQTHNTGW